VTVVSPASGAAAQEIRLPGTTQAFTEAPIFARTNGYLKRWYFDIGANVKAGQLLAEIETPEVDQQLQQARADLETAQANLRQAQITADRWQALLQKNAVSQQETDQNVSNLAATKATVASNAANVRRLEQTQGFQKIYAPFDGIITARNTDTGALIDAGGQSRELFRLAAIGKLRVFVSVPQAYAQAAKPGTATAITLEENPGKVYRGTLARTSNALDPTARTMLSEVEMENPGGEVLPGAYVVVRLRVGLATRGMTIPANALLFRSEGLRVAVVRDGRAELVPVKLGRDYGRTVEVVSGLIPADAVILDPADSLVSGTAVRVRASAPAK
jgi:RND family efflux transporter MFP subunit